MDKKASGPAFPVDESALINNLQGMSLRDYFAVKSLPSVFANWEACLRKDNGEEIDIAGGGGDGIAQDCYCMADAMLRARNGA